MAPKDPDDLVIELEDHEFNFLMSNLLGHDPLHDFDKAHDFIKKEEAQVNLYTIYNLCNPNQTEEDFLFEIKEQLIAHGIFIKKAICGKAKSMQLEGKNQFTRSLMIAGLPKDQSILLQDLGIGDGRIYGCGILLPHKSIDAVANFKED